MVTNRNNTCSSFAICNLVANSLIRKTATAPMSRWVQGVFGGMDAVVQMLEPLVKDTQQVQRQFWIFPKRLQQSSSLNGQHLNGLHGGGSGGGLAIAKQSRGRKHLIGPQQPQDRLFARFGEFTQPRCEPSLNYIELQLGLILGLPSAKTQTA